MACWQSVGYTLVKATLSIGLISGTFMVASQAQAALGDTDQVTRGQVCNAHGSAKSGSICTSMSGKLIWLAKSKSTASTISAGWGTASLRPFMVPSKGCVNVKVIFDINDPGARSGLGVTAEIRPFSGKVVALGFWMKDEFKSFKSTKTLRVCAKDWQLNDLSLGRIKPITEYLFQVRTLGVGFYDRNDRFRTGN